MMTTRFALAMVMIELRAFAWRRIQMRRRRAIPTRSVSEEIAGGILADASG
jgi:hypothetical protein